MQTEAYSFLIGWRLKVHLWGPANVGETSPVWADRGEARQLLGGNSWAYN